MVCPGDRGSPFGHYGTRDGDRLLSSAARESLENASAWGVSSATLYEMRCKHRIGRWPEVAVLVANLRGRLGELGFEVFALDATTMDLAGDFDWPHRDPFDRMIAASCIVRKLPLVSKDAALDGVPGGIKRVW